MKKILVTGADGFIGSHLVELLLQKNYFVRALAQYNSFNDWGWLEQIPPSEHLEIVTGDIRDSHYCYELTEGIDLIFHLAALIAIPYSYQAPMSYVDTNIKGTVNICEAALRNKVKRIISVSTSEVYGSAKYVPIPEEHPLQPQSPYSASKIAADAMAMSFYHAFQLPLIIARPFNTYGPRQSARAIIPSIITQIASGEKQIKLGNMTPTRDFNYVLDTCQGLFKLGECEAAIGQVVNIGSNTEISMENTLHLIKKLMKSDVEFVPMEERKRQASSEVFQLRCDNQKLKSMTDFESLFTLEEGLKKTIDWFIKPNHLKRYKAHIYNV